MNRSDRPKTIYLPHEWHEAESLFGATLGANGELFLPPFGCTILHTPPAEAAAHVKPVRMAAGAWAHTGRSHAAQPAPREKQKK